MKEWWSEDPQEVMSFVFWLQRQVPPTDKDKRQKALEEIADKLNKKHKAPNKKAIAKFIGESNNEILESFKDFVSEKINIVDEASVNDERDRPLKAFVKKMVKNWGVSKEDVIYYIVNNIEKVTESEEVNEARSEASKIAKKSGVSKADVDKIQEIINNLTTASIAEAIATQTDMDVKQVEKVLTMMAKVYGGNLQIIIR